MPLTQQKNNHMRHVEDGVISGGIVGATQSVNALRELQKTLQGSHKQNISVKWDGSPAIIAGTDPSDGKFFVATKSIFNKSPRVFKKKREIDDFTKGDLNTKLSIALEELPSLGIKGIIQGDFLFGPGDLKNKIISGARYLTFHPNTIVYAIPSNSTEAKELKSKRIGIVWHTTYKGNSLSSLKASYGVDVKKLKPSSTVWYQDANLKDVSAATLSDKESSQVEQHLSNAEKLLSTIPKQFLFQIQNTQELQRLINQFNNIHVRKGVVVKNAKRHSSELVKWVKQTYRHRINSRKSEAGREGQARRLQELLRFFSPQNANKLAALFELQRELTLAKIILINKLNLLSTFGTFLKTNRGYRVTDQEGFVVVDKLGSDAVKLVNRMEFSYSNFSPEVLRGWDASGKN